ncbi:MAG: ferrochelatase, partial [Caldimonas sp.]
ARAAFIAAGGKQFGYIACLNDQHQWIAALATIALGHLGGWPTSAAAPSPTQAEEALENSRRRALAAGALR